jgi:hypothetical protein
MKKILIQNTSFTKPIHFDNAGQKHAPRPDVPTVTRNIVLGIVWHKSLKKYLVLRRNTMNELVLVGGGIEE